MRNKLIVGLLIFIVIFAVFGIWVFSTYTFAPVLTLILFLCYALSILYLIISVYKIYEHYEDE